MGRSRRELGVIGAASIGLVLLLAACGKGTPAAQGSSPGPVVTSPGSAGGGTTPSSPGQSPIANQSPVPAESNPPGDIPDSTVYVPYKSTPGGFTLTVPEGWARSTKPSSVTFVSSLNSITTAWASASSAPTVSSARSTDVPALQNSKLAFQLQSVKAVQLSGGSAVEIVYQANSTPNAVTGKQYRLVIERFELFKNGQEAIISLSSPVGADNVDPWRTVSESFRWL